MQRVNDIPFYPMRKKCKLKIRAFYTKFLTKKISLMQTSCCDCNSIVEESDNPYKRTVIMPIIIVTLSVVSALNDTATYSCIFTYGIRLIINFLTFNFAFTSLL